MWLSSDHPRLRRPGLAAIVASLALTGACIAAPEASADSTYPAGVSRPLIGQARALGRTARVAHRRPTRKKPRKPKLHGNPARALLAFRAMQKYYYIPGSGLYSGEPFSYLWPFSQALAATVSMANIPSMSGALTSEIHSRLIGLRNYLDTSNSGEPDGIYTS